MSTTTASFTTSNELQPYFADLSTLPRLSVQEEETLLCRLRLAQQGLLSAEQAQGARHRLIEGYLYRVIRLAKEQQSFFHRLSLADLIQEGNLGLLQAVENFDFTDPQGHFFAYATTCIRNTITRVLPRDGLLSIHRLQFWRLAQQGRLTEWDRAQPFSLDRADEEKRSCYDVLPACSALTPRVSDTTRLHVEGLLARLSAREQMVLRLYYGVEEADGRTLSRTEIAVLLGVTPTAVKGVLQRALRKLRAAPKPATPAQEPREKEAERQAQREAKRAVETARLAQAYVRLEAQGRAITMLTLAQEAQVQTTSASVYLCQCWGTIADRLQRAYAQLIPTEAAITVERLAKAARVGERAASDFLHEQRGTTRQARPRHQAMQLSAGTAKQGTSRECIS